MQPVKSLVFALALGGCAGQVTPAADVAPPASSLHSEFQTEDAGATLYGPFLAATLAQHDSDHAASASFFLEALEADPESAFVADRAFFQLLYAGRMDEAGKLAVKMQSADATEPDDLVRMMYILEAYKREDWLEARARLEASRGSGFGFLVSPILKAWTYAAEQDLEMARQSLLPLIEDPRLGVIGDEHFAYILDHAGRYDGAVEAYLALAAEERPASLQPLIAYADMMFRGGDVAGARAFLGEQTKRFTDNRYLLREGMRITGGAGPSQQAANPRGAAGLVFYRLATEFAQGRSPQAAVVYLRIASYLTPEVSEIYFLLGNLLEQLETPNAAVAAYAAVPSLGGLKPLADIRRIGALRLAGRDGEAEDLLRNGLVRMPTSNTLLVSLGDLLRDREDFEEAIIHYSRAIEQIRTPKPSDWFVFFARGVCYERSGQWKKAEADLEAALRLNPGEAAVLNYLGYSWIDRGEKIEAAKKMIEQAVAEQPDDGFITDSLGWVHFLTGDFTKAVTILEKAVALEPTDPTINDHLGDAYWRVGRRIEARFQWRHALESGAEGDEKKAILDKLEIGLPEAS